MLEGNYLGDDYDDSLLYYLGSGLRGEIPSIEFVCCALSFCHFRHF